MNTDEKLGKGMTEEEKDEITRDDIEEAITQDREHILSSGSPFAVSILDARAILEATVLAAVKEARQEERARIEAVFKEHVPPHAMDLEDSVWLKRLLNKAFQHDS